MALSMLNLNQYPSARKQAGPPAVTVRSNGQIILNTNAAKALEGCAVVIVFADMAAVAARKPTLVQLVGYAEAPAKAKDQCKEISRSKKSNGIAISMAGNLKNDLGYNYGETGNQTYSAKTDETKHYISFTLPDKLPAKKEVVARPRKVKAGTVATEAATATPVAATEPPASDDFELPMAE